MSLARPLDRADAPVFVDGLGVRAVAADAATGELLQILTLRPALTAVPSFEFALRERTARLLNFRHAYYARVRRIDRVQADGSLAVVSDHVEGTRLSEILRLAHARRLRLDTSAALCLVRQLVPAVALLHENVREASHGLIAPERLVVTPHGRLVIVEHVAGSAIEQLQFGRERFWQELRIAMPATAGVPRLDRRADVNGIGITALSLVLGRPLAADEFPHAVPSLLMQARDRSALGGDGPLSNGLRNWLARALQLDVRRAFSSAPEALAALEDTIAGDPACVPAPVALEAFLAQYRQAAEDELRERTAPASVLRAVPAPPVVTAAVPPTIEPAPPAIPAPAPAPVAAIPAIPNEVAAAPLPAPPTEGDDPLSALPSLAELLQERGLSLAAPAPNAPAAVEAPVCAAPDAVGAPAAEHDLPGEAEPAPAPAHADDETNECAVPDDAPAAPQRPRRRRWHRVAAAAALIVAAGAAAAFYADEGGDLGMLVVQSSPAGVEVFVDGVSRGMTPARVSLTAGSHILELRGRGIPRVIPLQIPAGGQVSQYLEFADTPATGMLVVHSQPAGAEVVVDGVARGSSPLTLEGLAPGDHVVVLQNESGSSKHVVKVLAGTTASLVAPVVAAVPEGPVSGWIRVEAPFSVEIHENGQLLGTTDTDRVMLAAGRHELQLVNATLGYRETRAVVVAPGKVQPITIALPNGTVSLNAVPWAEVWIDGRRIGETPLGNLSVPIGAHEIVFRHPELGEKRHAVSVTTAAPVRLSVDMK